MNTSTPAVKVEGWAEISHGWTVGTCTVTFIPRACNANGVRMKISGGHSEWDQILRDEGWIFVSRGNEAVDKSDPCGEAEGFTALARAIRRSLLGDRTGMRFICKRKPRSSMGIGWSVWHAEAPISPVEMGHRGVFDVF